MYSSFPLMYDAELTMSDLGSLPSSAREWQNIKNHELKRGLILPPRQYPERFANGDINDITLNNSGLAHQEEVFSGKVRNPQKYSQITDLQSYLQLVRDSDRQPTEAELIMARSDDIGLDARLIDLINKQSEQGNYYADQSQNFQRTLQKSVNQYFKEESKYKVPMQLEEEGLPSLFDLATIAGRKKAAKEVLKPTQEFRKQFREIAKGGKVGSKAIKALATAVGLPVIATGASLIESALEAGLSIDRILSGIEQNPDESIQQILNRLQES